MALEQPFSHWPFGKEESRKGQQSSHFPEGLSRRYDTNDSPFRHISPIPGAGRDFGTYPKIERPPRSVVREQVTQALNNRASQGFQLHVDPAPQPTFQPIQEDELFTPEPVQTRQQPPQDYFESQQPQEQRRGLLLMDRYGQGRESREPIRRSNSLVEFAEFIGQPPPQPSQPNVAVQQRRQNTDRIPNGGRQPYQQYSLERQPKGSPQQNSLNRPRNSPRQQHAVDRYQHGSRQQHLPNGQLNGFHPNHSLDRQRNVGHQGQIPVQQPPAQTVLPHPRPVAQPRPQPKHDLVYPEKEIQLRERYPPVPRYRHVRRQRKSRRALTVGLCLAAVGVLVVIVFVVAFTALYLVSPGSWPTSGLLLAGVVIGVLIFVAGTIFICHRCLSSPDDYVDPYSSSKQHQFRERNGFVGASAMWQETPEMTSREGAIPMTEFPEQPDPFSTEEFLDQELTPEAGLDAPNDLPNGNGPIANGIPTPLVFTSLPQATSNDYLY